MQICSKFTEQRGWSFASFLFERETVRSEKPPVNRVVGNGTFRAKAARLGARRIMGIAFQRMQN